MNRTSRPRWLFVMGSVAALLALGAAPALACGGLVGENGTIELVRTTTLAAYSDGVERYVTAFEFTGEGKEVGLDHPAPRRPTKVQRGGDWTLQRLALEVAPSAPRGGAAHSLPPPTVSAEVILEVEIDALDITVLRGGGDEVGAWATENGFLLTPGRPRDTRLLRRAEPGVHGCSLQRRTGRRARPAGGRQHPDHGDHPHRRSVGACSHPGPRRRSRKTHRSRRVRAHRRPSRRCLAGGTGLTLNRSEASQAIRCSTICAPTSG